MILKLSKAADYPVGGKAKGLTALIDIGINVPDGFVVTGPLDEEKKQELAKILIHTIHIPKAIRSSAIEEDGTSASFAGQYDTLLNVKGMEDIYLAVDQCRKSAKNSTVSAYAKHFNKETESTIPVVIQDMVKATKSGILFTANPVNNRRDQWLINVTYGLGEKLVSGIDSGEQYLLSHTGRIIEKGTLLEEQEVNDLYSQAYKIQDQLNMLVDLEWAIDENGKLFWLQVRPITTLKDAHLNELDGTLFIKDEIFTRGNIGEMMPGPVTPLTYSVFGRAIEVGLQDFYIACGAQDKFTDAWLYFRMFYNHLFFSMSNMYKITENVLLNKKENVEFSIMGDSLDNDQVIPKAPFYKRLRNQIKQFRYLSSGIKRMHLLEEINASFSIDLSLNMNQLYKELTKSLDVLNRSYAHHYCTSSQSGSYGSALIQILGKGKTKPSVEDHQNVSALLSGIEGIEGADLVRSLENLALSFKEDEVVKKWILNIDHQTFEDLIFRKLDPQNISQEKLLEALSVFLKMHGHRCIREAELREKSWSEDPVQLLDIIQILLKNGSSSNKPKNNFRASKSKIFRTLKLSQRMALNYILPRARGAVVRREYTKSMCINVQHRIKEAFVLLATRMQEKGLLDEIDQVFFLTHQELGLYLESGEIAWKKKARERQECFPDFFELSFPDVSYGMPEPYDVNGEIVKINGNSVSGIPVSAGKIEGRVRIIRDKKDVAEIQPGDIMICQYTDIGWSPFFSVISGLVTEIGSPLSHGAVVAREYGIPAVVNVKGAMQFFENDELVLLDGKKGIVKKLSIT